MLSERPTQVQIGSLLTVGGRVGGGPAKGVRAALEQRGSKRWRPIARARVAKGGAFRLRWRAPRAAGALTLRVSAHDARKRRVAVSRPWSLAVLSPGSGTVQSPPPRPFSPQGSGAYAPEAPVPPVPPFPPLTDFEGLPLSLPVGTEEAVDFGPWVKVLSVDQAPPFVAAASGGTLTLAAPVGTELGEYNLTITAQGCGGETCDLDLTLHVRVQVTSIEAPPGELMEFPSPSPDRLAIGTPLPEGLPGTRLSDELVLTLGTDESPGTRADAEQLAASVGAVLTGGVDQVGVFSIGWSEPQDLPARQAELASKPGVLSAGFREIGTVAADAVPPGDWSDDGQETIWPFTQAHVTEAWDLQEGGYYKVGIVDVGRAQPNHEDLNVVQELGPKGVAAHSTHVAGLACARANGIGVVGVAWDCPIVTAGIGTSSDENVLVAATEVAIKGGVKVANISLGPNLDSFRCATPAEHQARMLEGEEHAVWFRRLFGQGAGKNIVWTLSAGNNCENAAPSPWAQNGDLANVLVVGATNASGDLARFSTFGHDVEVAAPGGVDDVPPHNGTVGLWSTWLYDPILGGPSECGPGYRYCWDAGTSMAAPIVAGIAELIRSAYPTYNAREVGRCIVRTASGAATQGKYPVGYTPKILFEPSDALPIINAKAALECDPGEFSLRLGGTETIEGGLHEPLSVHLQATGGTAPYGWEYTGYGDSIDNLTLSDDGVLSGTPTYAGKIGVPVRVTDAVGEVVEGVVNVKIAFGPAPPISGHPSRLTAGNGNSEVDGITADGSTVLVSSSATDLTADPMRSEPGTDLFTIDTDTKQAHRITKGSGNSWGVISADGSTVVFESSATDLVPGADPNGDEYDLYAWRRATGAIERVVAGAANVTGISDDGSKVLFVVWEQGEPTYRLLSTQTKAVTVLPKDPSLEYDSPSALSGDGTKLLYTARPAGTNYVYFIHLRNLLTGADQNLGDQTHGTLRFADAGNYVVYGTYQGFFNEGTAVINLSTGQRTVLDGGVNGVFYAGTSSGGKCIVLHSWENTALTADLPNRGEKVYYDDLFSYNLETGKYTRLTNTYDIDTGSSGVAVADNCSEVAFDVPPGALDPERQEDYEPSDVYVRRP
jgi:Tol biopolymer transport system component